MNLAELRRRLRTLADPTVKVKLGRLIPGAKALGVKIPDLRALVSEYHLAQRNDPIEKSAALLDQLCQSGCREEILFGIFVLARRRKEVEQLPWKRVDRWLSAVDNWETCDALAGEIAGAIVARDLGLVDQLVTLTRSSDFWRRRFAVATAARLNQQGRRLASATLRICEPLLDDRERMVQKAVGWAIREATKSDKKLVVEFLRRHKSRIPRALLSAASEKLAADERKALLSK
jgi:3-methyladenine DNA glycosylase AlkD